MKKFLILFLSIYSIHSLGQIKESYVLWLEPKTGKQPVLSFRTSFDKAGNKLKFVQKLMDRYGDYSITTEVYTYTTAGKKKTLTDVYQYQGQERKVEFHYVYTDQGYEEVGPGGKTVYYLDTKGNVVREEYLNNAGVIGSQINSSFDDKRRLLKSEKKVTSSFEYLLRVYSYMDSTKQRTEHFEYTTGDSIRTIEDFLTDLNSKDKPVKRKCLTDGTVEILTYDQFDNEIDARTFSGKGELIRRRKTKYSYWK
jgi:hypothetical protein